jgi:hypothetical protein
MQMSIRNEDRVLCETPTPGKQPTRIPRWKYETVRRAILQALSSNGNSLAFRDLPGEVSRMLSSDERARLGSVSWYTTVVKLDLEVKGELERLPGSRPQRLKPT